MKAKLISGEHGIKNLKHMVLLSAACFMLLFSFYSSVNVYSKLIKLNGHENLGFQGLSVMYLFFCVGCFIGPSIANKYRAKRVMPISGLAYSLWMFSAYFATDPGLSTTQVTVSVMICSVIQGTGASIMWISQGKYMSDCVRLN